MVIILPQDRRYADIAESFAPLGEALGHLAGSKVHQVRLRNAYEQAGMPKNQAEAVSRLPRQQQQHAYEQWVERAGFPEQQSFQQAAPQLQQQQSAPSFQFQPQTLQRVAGLQALQMAPQVRQQVPVQSPLMQASQQGLGQFNQAAAQGMMSGQPREQLAAAQGGIQALQKAQQGLLGYQPQQQQLAQQNIAQQRQPGQFPSAITSTGMAPLLPSNAPQIAPRAPMMQTQAPVLPLSQQPESPLIGASPRLRAAQGREQREQKKLEIAERTLEHKLSQSEKAQEHAREKEANQETKAYYDQLISHHKAAQENAVRLNKMENLIEKGNLPTSAMYRFVKGLEESAPSPEKAAIAGGIIGGALGNIPGAAVGGGIGAVLGTFAKPVAGVLKAIQAKVNPDLEQFDKLSADFVKAAKPYFGNRLTDTDLNFYMQTVPTLLLTDNGKKAVIKNMREMMQLEDLEYNAAKYIIKQNNNKRPIDLSLQVANLIDPQIERLSNNIKEAIASV